MAARISREVSQGKTVYAYFNNDVNLRAPFNAKLLLEMVGARSQRQEDLAKKAVSLCCNILSSHNPRTLKAPRSPFPWRERKGEGRPVGTGLNTNLFRPR